MWKNTEYIKEIISKSINKTDVLNKLNLKNNGGNYNTLSYFITNNNIDVSHFEPHKQVGIRGFFVAREISEVLVKNSTYKSTNHLKNKLYKLNLKSPICELCHQDETWQGKRMSLILDHINGDRHDNRIENLRIVCPNCNATLETHCRGLNVKKEDKYTRFDLCECGNKKRKDSKTCKSCYHKNSKGIEIINSKKDTFIEAMEKRRKVQRPPYEELLEEISLLGYVGVGRKYGVSDNSIRKWIKIYKKNVPIEYVG